MWPMNGDATIETIAMATGLIIFAIVLVANELSHQIDELKNLTAANFNSLKKTS